jgi:hypothetical protein
MSRFEAAEHLGVIVQPRFHVEPTHDVELARHRAVRALRLGIHLIHRVAVRPLFLGQTRVRAEDAGLPQNADVGRVDVLIGREGDAVTVSRAVHCVGHVADSDDVAAFEECDAVFHREPLAMLDLVGERGKSRIADQRTVEWYGGRRHGVTPRIA